MADERSRADPDEILSRIDGAGPDSARAALKIFLGMSAGVGKTYTMLQEARAAREQGLDIVLGLVDTHGRPDTEALLRGQELFPRRRLEYKGIVLEELDLDGLIARKPAIAVVDELAHENAPGSRHVKRWQDVEELLEKGVSVWTAVNIQHLESYADVVEELTGAPVRERVPDTVFDRADEVRLIDVAPEELARRLEEGKIYTGGSSRAALENFFTPVNLGALREIALRYTTRVASRKLTAYARDGRSGPSEASLGERILVAVGSAPSSAHLVRWARRTAYALRADWTAVHVETGSPMRAEDRKRVEENLELARRLGAEVLELQGSEVPATVVELARSRGVSLIVIGRSGLSWAKRLSRRASISDRIIEDSAPIDVALVQDSESRPRERPLAFLGRLFGAPRRQYALLAAVFAALLLVGELASPLVGYRGLTLVFLAAVLGLSMIANPGPVAVLAVLSALALNFFFIPPLFTLEIGRAEDWILFAVYFLVSFQTSSLVSRARARESLLRERERAAAFLYGASRTVSDSRSEEEMAAASASLLRERYGSRACVLFDDGAGRLARGSSEHSGAALDEKGYDEASYAYAEGRVCGAGTNTLPASAYRYFPASSRDGSVGVVAVELPADRAWTRADDNLVQFLGKSIAVSVERNRSEARIRDASIKLESDRLGGILLDSVSHELRTPLTAITGSLSALCDDRIADNGEARRELVANALEQAGSLNSVVEDLLSLSRIESGMLRLQRTDIELADLARMSLRRAGPELASRRVELSADSEASAFVDAALAARLAANLLRNAARYSPEDEPIRFALALREGALAVRVEDRGPGVPAEELGSIFQKFARGRGAKGKGLGLGLAICRGIAEAHGGSIAARAAAAGGLAIEALLPFGPEGAP